MCKRLIIAALIAATVQLSTYALEAVPESALCWDYNHRPATWQHGYIVSESGDRKVQEWRFIQPGESVLESGSLVDGSGLVTTTKIKLGHRYRMDVDYNGWTHPGSWAQEWTYVKDPNGNHDRCPHIYYYLDWPQTFLTRVELPASGTATFKRSNGTPVVGANVEPYVPNSNQRYTMPKYVKTDNQGVAKVGFPEEREYQIGIEEGGYIHKAKVMRGSMTTSDQDSLTIPVETTFNVRRMGAPIANVQTGLFNSSTGVQCNDYTLNTNANGSVTYNFPHNNVLLGVVMDGGLTGFGPFAKGQTHTVVSAVRGRPELVHPLNNYNYMLNDLTFVWEDLSSIPKHLDYELNILYNDELVFSMPFTQNGVRISDFPQGIFTWQVWAFDNEDYAYAISDMNLFGCRIPMARSAEAKSGAEDGLELKTAVIDGDVSLLAKGTDNLTHVRFVKKEGVKSRSMTAKKRLVMDKIMLPPQLKTEVAEKDKVITEFMKLDPEKADKLFRGQIETLEQK